MSGIVVVHLLAVALRLAVDVGCAPTSVFPAILREDAGGGRLKRMLSDPMDLTSIVELLPIYQKEQQARHILTCFVVNNLLTAGGLSGHLV